MTVTYSAALTDDVSRVRFWLRDTAAGAGPLPGDANFADSELAELVDLEGNWQGAVAAGFEALASAWARHPTFSSGDLSVSRSDIARGYREQAELWRRRYGAGGATASTVTIGSMVRADAYSDDHAEYTRA